MPLGDEARFVRLPRLITGTTDMDSATVTLALIVGVILLGVVGAGVVLRFPKPVLAAALLLVFVSSTLERLTRLSWFGYLDEVGAGLALIAGVAHLLSARRKPRWPPELGLFAVFIAAAAISAAVAHVEFSLALVGAVAYLKAFIFLWSAAQFEWTTRDGRIAYRWTVWLVALILVCVAMNLVTPAAWNNVFANRGVLEYRYGLPALVGPFVHPTILASALGLAGLLFYVYRLTIRKTAVNAALMLGSIIGSVFAFRRRQIAAVALAAATVRLRAGAVSALLLMFLVAPLVIVAGWGIIGETIDAIYQGYFADVESSARTLLTRDSVFLAAAHFPFGVGLAQFGSAPAAVAYSPVYVELGYGSVYGLSHMPGRGNWLTDTMWPAILGEAGFPGAAAYLVGLLVMARRFVRMSRAGLSVPLRFIGQLGLGWWVLVMVDSIASPVFTAAPMFPFLFVAAGVAYSIALSPPATGLPGLAMTRKSVSTYPLPRGRGA
jgi:hypothetical protein